MTLKLTLVALVLSSAFALTHTVKGTS
uniref:Uncharacterized protein n=1 Tax=Anguilla anguilla TaxID=7936 RepID=A0A0E9VX35_ANGAN